MKVERATYIGGCYGAASELSMMKEIRARGPIVADIKVPLTFSFYTSGIFSDDHAKELSRMRASGVSTSQLQSFSQGGSQISTRTLADYDIEWEFLNHSIAIVGWGEENGVKFWICKNSYGPDWGEGGYFRVRRGQNDFGIESQPSTFDPSLVQ